MPPRLSLIPALVSLAAISGCESDDSNPRRAKQRPRLPRIAQLPPNLPNGPVRIDPPARAGAMAPNLSVHQDTVLAVWIEPGSSDAQRLLRYARYAGGRWSKAVTITRTTNMFANWADIPNVRASADGRTLVARWARRSGPGTYSYDVALMRSRDAGKHWHAIGTPHRDGTPTEHGFVSLVAAGKTVRAFWLDGRHTQTGKPHAQRGAMSLRTGTIGDEPQPSAALDSRVCDCCGTDAVNTASGPLVVYRNRDENEVRDIWFVRHTDKGWSPPAPVHTDGWRVPGCPVNGPAVAVAGKRVAVAWYTYAGNQPTVRLAFSDNNGKRFAAPIIIDRPRGKIAPLGRVDVVMATNDEAIVTWLASGRGKANILARRVKRDGRVSPPVVLATTRAAREAGFPRLARVGDTLILVWTATKPSALRGLRFRLDHIPAASNRPVATPATNAGLLQLGAPLPAYAARDLRGNLVNLSSLRGKPLLLNFWATWCEPCRREIPVLNDLHARYGGRGLRVIGVNLDGQTDRSRVTRFAKRLRLSYASWLDHADTASRLFGIGVLPASFLFDTRGNLLWRHVGPVRRNDASLARALSRAMGKPKTR